MLLLALLPLRAVAACPPLAPPLASEADLVADALQALPEVPPVDGKPPQAARDAQRLSERSVRGEDVQALAHRLIAAHPGSLHAALGYRVLGEHHLARGDHGLALDAHSTAWEISGMAFDRWRQARGLFSVGEYREAIAAMKDAVGSISPSERVADPALARLQDVALRDLVRFLADAGDSDSPYAWFSKQRPDLARHLLVQIATRYRAQGKHEQAIQIVRRLVAEDPLAPTAPISQCHIIESFAALDRPEALQAEIQRLHERYGESSAWWRANAGDSDVLAVAEGIRALFLLLPHAVP